MLTSEEVTAKFLTNILNQNSHLTKCSNMTEHFNKHNKQKKISKERNISLFSTFSNAKDF